MENKIDLMQEIEKKVSEKIANTSEETKKILNQNDEIYKPITELLLFRAYVREFCENNDIYYKQK
jgi:hypothetical protein